MSTYSLSGSGTHALSSGTTGLQVSITTPSSVGGLGRSNPVAKYDQGLIRFSDGTAYWAPVPILGGPQFIPVPANSTSIGYALIGGAVVSVTEVINGTVFFSGGTQSVETLSDVQVTSIADGQILEWIAVDSKWENRTPSAGGASLTSSSVFLNSDITGISTNTYKDVLSLTLAAGTWLIVASLMGENNVSADWEMRIWDGTNVFKEMDSGYSRGYGQLVDQVIVTLGASTTVKVSVTTDSASSFLIHHTAAHNGTANKCSSLTAVKIA